MGKSTCFCDYAQAQSKMQSVPQGSSASSFRGKTSETLLRETGLQEPLPGGRAGGIIGPFTPTKMLWVN